MAKLVQAFATFAPRVVHNEPLNTQDIINEVANVSALSKGDVSSFLQNLVDVLYKFISKGHNVHIDGIGHFSLSISTKGKINVNVNIDHHLENQLNEPSGFQGTILNKDMISENNEKIVEAWNKAHPADPVEVAV